MYKKYTIFVFLAVFLLSCEKNTNLLQVKQEPQCIKQQSHCVINTEAGDITLGFDVEYLLAEQPFNLIVSFLDNKYEIRRGYIEGVTMYMGKVPLFFNESLKSTQFIAEVMLGSCSETKMTWRIWLELLDKNSPEKPLQTVAFTVVSYRDRQYIPTN